MIIIITKKSCFDSRPPGREIAPPFEYLYSHRLSEDQICRTLGISQKKDEYSLEGGLWHFIPSGQLAKKYGVYHSHLSSRVTTPLKKLGYNKLKGWPTTKSWIILIQIKMRMLGLSKELLWGKSFRWSFINFRNTRLQLSGSGWMLLKIIAQIRF